MTAILLMNLNFIELLTILQLITIWNTSDGNNILPEQCSPRNSFSNLKQRYSAVLGLGVLLSSPTWRGAI